MPALRRLRGSVVGLTASGLGMLGHAMAGGMVPSAPVAAVVTGLLVALGVGMSGRPWSVPSLLGVLVGAQVALHVVVSGSTHAHAMGGMSHHSMPGLLMTGCHLVVASLSAILLHRGEQWCLALVELLLGGPLRAASLTLLPLPRRPRLAPGGATYGVLRLLRLDHCLSRRGPPALSPV